MKARILLGSVAALAFAVAACKDETPLYPGGPAGAAVRMQLSKASFTLPDGGTSSLAAQVFDSAGNVAANAVTIATCSAAVVTTTDSATAPTNWAKAATVTAAAPGASCITATSDNGIVDTATVTVGPATLVITGPQTIASGIGATVVPFVPNATSAAASFNATGLPAQVYKVTGYNKAGTALPAGSFFHQWGSVDSLLLRPWSRSADSVIVTQPGHLGNTRLVVTAVGGATAVLPVAVVPDTFTKTGATLTVLGTGRPSVDSIRATRCAVAGPAPCLATQTNPAFGNRVFVDGVESFISPASTATSQFIIMPPINAAHASTVVPVLLGNMGTLNGALLTWEFGTVTASATAGTQADLTDPANDAAATTPNATVSAGATPATGIVRYGTLTGANCVDNATNPAVAGSIDCLDWFSFNNSDAVNSRPLSVAVLWLTDADIDITLFDNTGAGVPLSTNGSTRAPGAFNGAGESVAITIPKATTVRLRVRFHSAGSAPTTLYRLIWTQG